MARKQTSLFEFDSALDSRHFPSHKAAHGAGCKPSQVILTFGHWISSWINGVFNVINPGQSPNWLRLVTFLAETQSELFSSCVSRIMDVNVLYWSFLVWLFILVNFDLLFQYFSQYLDYAQINAYLRPVLTVFDCICLIDHCFTWFGSN